MSERPETSSTVFDPYGEPIAIGPACPTEAGDRRARRAAIALFWSLALALVAGRVYLGSEPVAHGVRIIASAAATVLR
ncbi:hypothetical protein [Methylobacterium sp. ID0610]|uniref:hypothetical protein n=1 Tax=Methylobacterium carpenticola TaxID=3344827 RepID=UPI0036C59954